MKPQHLIVGEIDQHTFKLAVTTEHTTFIINSEGGYLVDAFAIADYIESLNESTTICLGRAWSAAIPIFLAGKTRLIGENATLCAHYGHRYLDDNYTVKEMSYQEHKMNVEDIKYMRYILKKTNISKKLLKQFMKEEQILGSKAALKYGFTTGIYR